MTDSAISEISTEIGVLLWLMLLAFASLKGIDRRDPVAGATFVLFMTAAAAALVFAATGRTSGGGSDALTQAWTLTLFAGVATLRWIAGKIRTALSPAPVPGDSPSSSNGKYPQSKGEKR